MNRFEANTQDGSLTRPTNHYSLRNRRIHAASPKAFKPNSSRCASLPRSTAPCSSPASEATTTPITKSQSTGRGSTSSRPTARYSPRYRTRVSTRWPPSLLFLSLFDPLLVWTSKNAAGTVEQTWPVAVLLSSLLPPLTPSSLKDIARFGASPTFLWCNAVDHTKKGVGGSPALALVTLFTYQSAEAYSVSLTPSPAPSLSLSLSFITPSTTTAGI